LTESRHPLSRPFAGDGGHAVRVDLPSALLAAHGPFRWDDPGVVLLEDGRPLARPVGSHEEIRLRGGGRYSVWGTQVYLASSDGSDPATNGRTYEVALAPAQEAGLLRTAPHVRLGFVGNMNNEAFVLCEAARALGFDARLYTLSPEPLHDPCAKEPAWGGVVPDWIHRFDDLAERDFVEGSPALDRLVAHVREHCDLAFLNGLAPSVHEALGMRTVFFSTGSDLVYYADYAMLGPVTATWSTDFRRTPEGRAAIRRLADLVTRQRDALLACELLVTGHPRGLIGEVDDLLDEIGLDDSLRAVRRCADIARVGRLAPPEPDPDGLRVYSFARVDYVERSGFSSMDYKGTDVLLEGFARFLARGGRGRLHLPRKGHDLAAAEALAERLGVADRVEWFENLPYARYVELMARADLVCDAVSPAGPAGPCQDALLMGRAVLGDLRPDAFAPVLGGEGYPGLHVTDAEGVAEALAWAQDDPAALAALARRGREFAERELSPERFMRDVLGVRLAGPHAGERPAAGRPAR
jgi:glycosyltransferase involved in cell wall biosynthesis